MGYPSRWFLNSSCSLFLFALYAYVIKCVGGGKEEHEDTSVKGLGIAHVHWVGMSNSEMKKRKMFCFIP